MENGLRDLCQGFYIGDACRTPTNSHCCWDDGLGFRYFLAIRCSSLFVLRSAEFLGECDEKPFRPADVAQPIRVFIPDYFAYELGAALAEPFKRLVDLVHGKHDAEVA